MKLNPAAKYMMENVVMSWELRQKGDEQMQEEYMAGRFDEISGTVKAKASVPECDKKGEFEAEGVVGSKCVAEKVGS